MSWEVASVLALCAPLVLLYLYQRDLPDDKIWAQWLKVLVLGTILVLAIPLIHFAQDMVENEGGPFNYSVDEFTAFYRGYVSLVSALFVFVALKLIRDTFRVLQEVNKRYGR